MSASDPDVCNVYNDPKFRKAKCSGGEAKVAAGITAEGFREFCRGLSARALGWPELGAAAASLEGGERMRRMVESLAERYESTREEMRGSGGGWTPRCPLCDAVVPAHKARCDFGRFLKERRAAAAAPEKERGGRTPPNAEAVVLESAQQIDGVFNRTRPPAGGGPDGAAAPEFPGVEYLWRLYAACMRRRGWIVATEGGLQIDGLAQQEAFEPIRNVFLGAAAGMDAVVAELVGSLERARIACLGGCRRNNHFTSDCPSTHFIKRPCTCRCDCPAGPHNAAIDAAIARVPKAPKAPA